MSDTEHDETPEEDEAPPPSTMRRRAPRPEAADTDDTPPPASRRRRSPDPVDDSDDDEPVAPRRRRAPKADEGEQEHEPADEDDEDEEEATQEIRAGWTEGQKTMDSTSSFAQNLKLDKTEQLIKFLDDTPYASYRRHWVERMTSQGAQKRAYTCLESVGKSCPLCESGDRPQAVSAFNVVVIGDDGQLLLKSWDCGVRLFGVLKAAGEGKNGPLSKHYYSVNKTGTGGSTQFNVNLVRERDLDEDWDVDVPTPEEIKAAGRYDSSIIQIPKKRELQEIVDEQADYDD